MPFTVILPTLRQSVNDNGVPVCDAHPIKPPAYASPVAVDVITPENRQFSNCVAVLSNCPINPPLRTALVVRVPAKQEFEIFCVGGSSLQPISPPV